MKNWIALAFTILALGWAAPLSAYQTPCAPDRRHPAGVQRTMRIVVPQSEQETLTAAVQAYGEAHNMLYGSVGYHSPRDGEGSSSRILQSAAYGVAIEVTTTNQDDIGLVEVSGLCTGDEDWRPYWRDFTAFIQAHYRVLP